MLVVLDNVLWGLHVIQLRLEKTENSMCPCERSHNVACE